MNKAIPVLLLSVAILLAGCTKTTGGDGNDSDSGGNGGDTGVSGSITVTIVGQGRVVSSPNAVINCPTACSGTLTDEFPFLNARAADGWIFLEWQGAPGCFAESCPLTPNDLREPLDITAVFEQVDTDIVNP